MGSVTNRELLELKHRGFYFKISDYHCEGCAYISGVACDVKWFDRFSQAVKWMNRRDWKSRRFIFGVPLFFRK